jgi:Ca-activated chloride channel family protein
MIMRFQDPLFLLLLLLLAPMIYLYFARNKVKKGAITFSDLHNIKKIAPSPMLKMRHSLFFFRVAAVSLLVLALARPQSGQKSEEVLTEGVDIMLVLDISGSMQAEDLRPKNRLAVAKNTIADFVKKRKSDRLGLVVFSSKAFTQCPLTLDYGVLLTFLERVDFGQIEDGTAIGSAIAVSANRLRDSKTKSKVMVLLTDGANNQGEIDPLTAAKAAAALGIKIYTVGVGVNGYAPFPVDDPVFGRRYVNMPSIVDEASLQEIANTTGGKFYRATNRAELENIYNTIDKLERTEIKAKEFMRYSELFPLFLIPGLLFLGLEVVLANTRFRKIP